MEWEDIFGDRAAPPRRERSVALEMLATAAETEPPISFRAATMTLPAPGWLRSADHDGVVVELSHPPAGALEAGATVAVRYPLAGRNAGFTAEIVELSSLDTGGVRMVLSIPDQIRTNEQRAAVRIPIPDATLAAALLENEKPVAVRALDISLSGMCIEVHDARITALEPGHRRMVALKLGNHKVLLESEVRRCDSSRHGLAFILRDERPPALVKIISKLMYRGSAT